MQFTLLASTLIGLAAANEAVSNTASTPKAAACPRDTGAWHLRNIVKDQYKDQYGTAINHLAFDFYDNNKGIELKTECCVTLTAKDGKIPTLSGSHDCKDKSVSFSLDDDNTLHVQRGYEDPCVGTPDYVTAFGEAKVPFKTRATQRGQEWVAKKLDVKITSYTA